MYNAKIGKLNKSLIKRQMEKDSLEAKKRSLDKEIEDLTYYSKHNLELEENYTKELEIFRSNLSRDKLGIDAPTAPVLLKSGLNDLKFTGTAIVTFHTTADRDAVMNRFQMNAFKHM
jgi:hypothetical protein